MTSATPRIVVVGAGLGGLRVAEGLREGGHTGPLTLLGEELDHPYDRPPLSKDVLRGETVGPPHLRALEEYAELDLDLRLGRRAVALDPVRRSLILDDGTEIVYDTAVLAPGAVPRRLPGAAEREGLHLLRTHDDAVALRDAVRREGALTVIGGGFLGCEVAASARTLGIEVDLVELLAGPLVRVLGPRIAEAVAGLHERQGVRLHTGTGVAAVHGSDRVEAVELGNGTVLPSRVVLVALGVAPQTSWLDGSGLERGADGAIRCDRFGRTTAPDVWALGDAAAWQDATGAHRRVEHWMSAVEQAATVAGNVLADEPVPHAGLSYFWSDQYSSSLQAIGEVAPDTESEVHPIGEGLLALHTDAGRLLGVVTLDARRQVGRARRLLKAGAGIDEARAALLG